METVKKTKEHTIFKKNSGRFAVKGLDKKWINGEEKINILLKAKLIKLAAPKKVEAPVVEETKAEEAKKEVKAEAPKVEAAPAKSEEAKTE